MLIAIKKDHEVLVVDFEWNRIMLTEKRIE